MTLLTLGHGTATQDELGALIRGAGIQQLVDVRTVPKSRLHPHVVRERLEVWVPELTGAAYRWERDLGGFRKAKPDSPNVALRNLSFRGYADYMETDAFSAALAKVLGEAAERRVAVMCSESLWWRCHRRLISDAATLLHGVQVQHLAHTGKLAPHVPTSGVRVSNGSRLRYDVPA